MENRSGSGQGETSVLGKERRGRRDLRPEDCTLPFDSSHLKPSGGAYSLIGYLLSLAPSSSELRRELLRRTGGNGSNEYIVLMRLKVKMVGQRSRLFYSFW